MLKIRNWILGAWLVILGYLQIYPGAITDAWMMVPDDLKAAVPVWVPKVISGSVLFITFLAKMGFLAADKKKLNKQVDHLTQNGAGGDGNNP